MGTIPSVQLFRNSIIITGRTEAIKALDKQKASVADGGLILARYSEDGTENGVKTLLGIVRNGGGTNVQLTVIDVEGAAENVQSAITSAIDSLNKGDAEVEGEYVSSVSEDKGIITVTRKPLPSVEKKVSVGKAVTAVTQTNGLVSVEFGGVAAANVSVADSTGKFDSDNVEGALLEIKTSLDNAIGTGGSVETQITNKINALNSETSGTSTSNHITVGVKQVAGKITSVTVSDSDIASAELLGTISDAKDKATAFGRIAQEAADREAAIKALNFGSVGGNGQVITTISQTDGKVSATAATLSADNVAFTSSDTAFTSNNVSAALDALYTRSGDGSKVVIDSGTTTEGYSKTYTFTQGGIEIGKIDIPKDLVVKSGSVVKGNWNDGVFTENVSGSGTALRLVIANKEETPIYINTLDLVKDHTGGNGIAISDTNEISVKIAEGSEKFLSVDEKGVKLDGVQNAINKAAASATTKVVKTDGGSHVTVTPSKSDVDGSVTYQISESDIASAELLGTKNDASTAETAFGYIAKEVTARTAAIGALNLTQVGGDGKVITTISQSSGKVSVTAATLGAENVSASTITDDGTKVAVTGDNVKAQIESLAKSIKSASTTAAAAHTKVTAKPSGHVTVEVSNDGSHDVVTIAENDIASATDLGTETTTRQNQDDKIEASIGLATDGSHVTTSGNYTNGATTVVGEIAALDTQLKAVSDTLGTGVSTVATVTAQLQALSGITGDASGVTSVEGAKAYAKDLVDNLNAEVGSTTGTSKTEAIKIVQAHGKIDSITLGAFDCGTY